MTVAAYIRVSSLGQSYEMQRDEILRSCPNVSVWYEEKASAKTNERAALQRLLADVRMGRVSALYIFRLDRLTRTGVGDTFKIVDELRRAGVTLRSVSDGVVVTPNKDDVTSDVLVFALSLAAKLELTAKNERIAAARTRAAKLGKSWGRPPRMTDDQVAKARSLKSEGKSTRYIARCLGVPLATVFRCVSAA